jgi:hypothetical protein
MKRILSIVLLTSSMPAVAQTGDAVRLSEAFTKDSQYHVACQVEITGTLTIPGKEKQASPQSLKIAGKSAIKYDERVLQVGADRRVERTVRQYRQLEFERRVGEDDQQSKLRPEAHRLVILRHNQYEVPFCPSGPLTWGEIELVRTDVFVPALQGLLPKDAVRMGDRWQPDTTAIQELTDLEKIDKADFTCTLEKITTFLGKRHAHVNFEGKVQGVGEDGNARHELRGSYYVDLDANFLSYVYVKGTHHLLDKAGNPTGKIEGTFVITRTPTPHSNELSDAALRGLTLEPNADNTQLLFEHPQVGARFQYPRNWRVAGANDKQIGIDEKRGSGLLITLSPAASTPNGAQFYQETLQFLTKQQAKILRSDKTRELPGGVETFAFEAEINKEKVILLYYTKRQGGQGATFAARILPADLVEVHRDTERIVRSLQLRGK